MSADINLEAIDPGMPVFTTAGEELGPVEGVNERGIRVQGREVPRGMIDRVDEDGVRLAVTPAAFTALQDAAAAEDAALRRGEERDGQLVVPIIEERVRVNAQETDLGEIVIRKRIIEETRMVPVIVRREEAEVLRRGPGDPPIPDTNEPGVELIRIPVRGQEPTIGLEAVVAREIVVSKDVVMETQPITATVRREHVEVSEHYRDGRTAAADPRYQGRSFAEVEPELRREHEATGGSFWERIRDEFRAGFEDMLGR